MSETVLGSHRHLAPRDPDRDRRARWWAVGVLALSTVVLLAYVACLVTASWLATSVLMAVTARPALPVDLAAVVSAVAPGLLVGWCTGLAASAVLSRGEALGPRVTGVVAGLVGTVLGYAMPALTGLV